MSKPVLLMLLSRHPYAERSGRATMLKQRIDQAGREFQTRLVVFGEPAEEENDAGIEFVPMANPLSVVLNAMRIGSLPLQTWLYYSAAARAHIETLAHRTAAAGVYVDMLRLAPLVEGLPPHVARIVDYDDLLSLRYRHAAARDYEVMGFLSRRVGFLAPVTRALAKPLLQEEARRCDAYERAMLDRADLVLFTSTREAALAARPGAQVLAAPPLIAPYEAHGEIGERLIFLGNMRYAENAVMLRALAEAARGFDGDWSIDVVGDHDTSLVGEFDPQRFKFVGRIADLTPLAGAGVFLAPVLSGSGVKLKVLDALALGCPVVATPKACEGLNLRAARDVLVAPDAVGVLRLALALRGRAKLKAGLAARGRAYLLAAHAPERGAQIARAMIAAVERAKARQETL